MDEKQPSAGHRASASAGVEAFTALVADVTSRVANRALDADLARELNATSPASGPEVTAIAQMCRDAIRDGWMCSREADGIRYGRVVKAGPATHGFSVDVVDMPADNAEWSVVEQVLLNVTARSELPDEQGDYFRRTITVGVKPRNLLPQ